MTALENAPGFIIFLVVSGLLVSFIVGLAYFFHKKHASKESCVCCPHCNLQSKASGWGKFHCRSCGSDFLADTKGKAISSMRKPWLQQFGLWLIISLIYIFIEPPRGNEFFEIGVWVLVFFLFLVVHPLCRKKFPSN